MFCTHGELIADTKDFDIRVMRFDCNCNFNKHIKNGAIRHSYRLSNEKKFKALHYWDVKLGD